MNRTRQELEIKGDARNISAVFTLLHSLLIIGLLLNPLYCLISTYKKVPCQCFTRLYSIFYNFKDTRLKFGSFLELSSIVDVAP